MNYQFGLLSWILFYTAIIGVFVTIVAWRRRSSVSAQYLALMEMSVVIWAITAAIEAAATTVPLKLFWSQISYIGITGSTASYFFLALSFGQHVKYLTLKYKLSILAVPTLALLAVATNNWHHSFYTDISIIPDNNIAIYLHGSLFWIYTAYVYSLLVIGLGVLYRAIVRFPSVYKSQSTILIIGAILPFTGNVIYLFNLNPVPGVDWTPIAFGLSGLILTWGIFRYHLLDLLPVARYRLVETMLDGILVIDDQDRIADFNPAMEKITGIPSKDALGKQVTEVLKDWKDFIACLKKDVEGQVEIKHFLQAEKATNFYSMQILPIYHQQEFFSGKLILFRDITERKQAEAAQEQSKSLLKAALESTVDGILVVSSDGHWSSYNQKFVDMWGIPKSIYKSGDDKKALDYVLDSLENPDEFIDKVNDLYEDLERDSFDTIKMKDGRIFERYSQPQWLDEKVVGRVWSFRDVTERNQVEMARVESEVQFRTLFESSPIGIGVADLEGNLILFNDAMLNAGGYSVSDIQEIGNVSGLYYNHDQRLNALAMMKENGQLKDYPVQFRRKDGSAYDAMLSLIPIHFKGKPCIQAIVEDITIRKQAESKLKNYADRIAAINQASHTLASSLDLNTVVDHCAKIAKQMFEADDVMVFVLDEDKNYLKPITSIGGYKDKILAMRLKLGEGLSGTVAQTGVSKIVNRIDLTDVGKHVPGTPVEPESLMSVPMKVTNEVIGVLTLSKLGFQEFIEEDLNFMENLADLSAVVIQNARLFEEVKQSAKMKTLFLANVSHEIRTPLNTILGYSELIENSARNKVSSEEGQYFDIIRSSSERLLHTIHNVLEMSQLEAMSFELRPENLDLNDLAKMVVAEFISHAEEKKLGLFFESQVKKAMVRADKYCVSQALSNLLENAIKYTSQGRITVSITEREKLVTLEVIDTGIGMENNYLDNLFDMFSQESTGYTKEFQGVGLGLALTRRYLELNEIPITVKSEKNAGTTFTLVIPAVDIADDHEIKTATQEKRITDKYVDGETKGSVLVVDDDVNAQSLIKYFLQEKYQTLSAGTVAEAKQQLKDNEVDIVLLDLSLAGYEDGMDLTRYLRKTKRWKNLPIVALTAHAFSKDRDNCIEAGCDDYMAKPVNKKDLHEKIGQYIG